MAIIDALIAEYQHETGVTRKVIDRLPADKLSWRPHEKSMAAGKLASHLAEIQGWGKDAIEEDGFDIQPSFKPFDGKTKAEILQKFDGLVVDSLKSMKNGVSDAVLMKPWALKMQGHVVFEMPKIQVLRAWVLNHQIHHRGQLSVYLRLLNVPVPSIYGPSADEQG
jgi:uncharacterized damage-inducible protein DinB